MLQNAKSINIGNKDSTIKKLFINEILQIFTWRRYGRAGTSLSAAHQRSADYHPTDTDSMRVYWFPRVKKTFD